MSYSIIVDSCCDFNSEMRQTVRCISVPLTIQVGDRSFFDDGTVDQAELIAAMDASDAPVKTACPAPADYLAAFEASEGDIYVVTLSALLSGSHNSAWQASRIFLEEHPERSVYVCNSCSAASGETLLALKIDALADSGLPFQKVVAEVERYRTEMNTLFVLENLDNLKKNGRLTKMQALLTGALRIKLLLGSTPEGEICKRGQALSVKQALSKMVELFQQDEKHVGKTLCIAHCNCPERAKYLKALVMRDCSFSGVVIVETGALSTAYANDGGVICAY